MENKSDWEEIEKWASDKKQKDIEKFGLDTDKIDIEKQNKKMRTVAKVSNSAEKVGKFLVILSISLFIFIVTTVLYSNVVNFKESHDVSVESIMEQYNRKMKIISKEVDEKENGKYVFELKENKDIHFIAIKRYGHLKEDYVYRLQKYLFDNWESPSKESFYSEEKLDEDGILYYTMYIEINGYDDIDNAMSKVNEFLIYCDDWIRPEFSIRLKENEKSIWACPCIEQEMVYVGKWRFKLDIEKNLEEVKKSYQEQINNT